MCRRTEDGASVIETCERFNSTLDEVQADLERGRLEPMSQADAVELADTLAHGCPDCGGEGGTLYRCGNCGKKSRQDASGDPIG